MDLVAKLVTIRDAHKAALVTKGRESRQRDAHGLWVNQTKQYALKLAICQQLIRQTYRRDRPANHRARAHQQAREQRLLTVIANLGPEPPYPTVSAAQRRLEINKLYMRMSKYKVYLRGAVCLKEGITDKKCVKDYQHHLLVKSQFAQWRQASKKPRTAPFEELLQLYHDLSEVKNLRDRSERAMSLMEFEKYSLEAHNLTRRFIPQFLLVQVDHIPGLAYHTLVRLLQARTGSKMYVTIDHDILPTCNGTYWRSFVCLLPPLTLLQELLLALLGVQYTNEIPTNTTPVLVFTERHCKKLLC